MDEILRLAPSNAWHSGHGDLQPPFKWSPSLHESGESVDPPIPKLKAVEPPRLNAHGIGINKFRLRQGNPSVKSSHKRRSSARSEASWQQSSHVRTPNTADLTNLIS
ncbi:hypothetical protein ACFXTH_040956 [Malus domestica]